MSRFIKLVHFELNRFWKLYMVLIGVTIVTQIIGVFATSKEYLDMANLNIYKELMPKATFIDQYGTLSFANYAESLWFFGPIGLCVVALVLYVFFIWYRDWTGKNTFSYRLLMLPVARLHLYLAKATTIFLFLMGLLALQVVLLVVELQLFKWIIPSEFLTKETLSEIANLSYLMIILPTSLADFVLYYGMGMIAVFVVFTAILFERSYRVKGIVMGIVYCGLSLLVFLAPLLVDSFLLDSYFYPIELFLMEIGTGFVVLAGAIWTGNYLINHKIRA